MVAPLEPDGWVRLHPLSPLLDAGKLMVFAGLLALRAWADGVEVGRDLAPGLTLLLLLLGALFLVGLLGFAYAAVAHRFRAYRLTDRLGELRSGVLFRTHRQLPFDRIESVDTVEPLIPRLLGLAEVRVHAISTGDQDLRLRYLTRVDALVLREELASRRTAVGVPAGAPGAPPSSAPLLRVPASELLLGYLLIPVGRVLVVGLWAVLVVAVLGRGVDVVGVALAGGLFFVLPALFNAGRQVERLWGFELDDGPTALVIRRGLLNLSTQRIHPGRVQAIRIDQPLLWRPIDRYRLVVDVAGHRGAEGPEGEAAGDLLPIAPAEVVRGLLSRLEVGADIEALAYVPSPRRARWRSLRSPSFRVARTPTHLVVRSGVLWRRTTIVPHARVESARVVEGPWQRRLGLATLELDTAGPRVRVVARHRDRGEAAAQAEASARIAAGAVTAGL